jgi:hypothetical protein
MNESNPGPPPENNLVWAILATVMCCLPLGIVALLKANKVDHLWYQGRYEEAQKAADDAKKWSIYSAVSVGLIVIIYFIIIFFAIIIESAG